MDLVYREKVRMLKDNKIQLEKEYVVDELTVKGVVEIVQEQHEYAQLLAVNEKDAAELACLDIIKDWFTVK